MLKIKVKNVLWLMLYALPNTVLNFSIVYIINKALSGSISIFKGYSGLAFAISIVFAYILNIVFQKKLNAFSFKLLYDNEKNIFEKILNAPLLSLEKFGSNRFFTAVEDLRTFSVLPYTITHTVNSLLMLALCLSYMFTLSVASALIVIVLIAIIAGCYYVVINLMSKQVATLRELNENYYHYVDDVIKGFKLLKLSFTRRENIRNKYLIPNRDAAEILDFKINYVFLSINLISQYGLYFVVGIVLFLLPAINLLSVENVIAYVVIILFVSGPINNLINLQQIYTKFLVSNSRIKKFFNDFEALHEESLSESLTPCSFESVKFQNVSFVHKDESSNTSFLSGPLNLEIKRGDVIFIVGGNGSGKSTFINILTGLYNPNEGKILLNNDVKLSFKDNIDKLIAAVFTDNHLFSHNYENFDVNNNELYQNLLKLMQLENVLSDTEGSSFKRGFSKGQSKRISLVHALLENKPILVLDEWAADQDPHFRKFFYNELIPMLKQNGKTIVAVTHDDVYFNQADRIIKFEYGQVTTDVIINKESATIENIWT